MPKLLINSKEGLYRVRGQVTAEELVSMASSVLQERLSPEQAIQDPKHAASFLQLALAHETNEYFAALFLNSQHGVLRFERLFAGTINSVSVHPRVVVQRALACNAAAVIFAHNHPSNDCEPSSADRLITQKLTQALELFDVRVLDHFVVSRNDCVSMAARGLL